MSKQIGKPYKIQDKNRVCIPEEILKMYNLKNGDLVLYFLEENNEIRLGFRKVSRETIRKISQVKT